SNKHLVEVSKNTEGDNKENNDSMSIRYRSKPYFSNLTLTEQETTLSEEELKAILPMYRACRFDNDTPLSSSSSSELKDATGTPICYYIYDENKTSLGYGPTFHNWLSQSFTTEL
ncbi:leucine-rich repeat domain-containing protein, partial [Escherichia coli]|nr:leucine-rich repeat domain-containing protein [Escherichia coli]